MNPEVEEILLTIAVLLIAVLLPIIPTIVIYRLFPDSQVVVHGPFKGLTVKAAGAFGAYLITFVGATPFAWFTIRETRTIVAPTWVIRGHLDPRDANGKSIKNINAVLKDVQVSMSPNSYQFSGSEFWVKVPESDHRLPALVVSVPGFFTTTLSYADATVAVNGEATTKKIIRDDIFREIVVKEPIEIDADPTPGTYNPPPAPLAQTAVPVSVAAAPANSQ
jgi:hypothetical protein